MRSQILEREHVFECLAEAAAEAATGRGCVALVYGEAGIGKTSVVEAAQSRISTPARLLIGRCDDLATARVLGPFRDLIGQVGEEAETALVEGTQQGRILEALRSELDQPDQPTLLVIEDVQWADDATLDVLRYLVRRVADMHLVLLLTYRDDELLETHPLLQLLGNMSDRTLRFPLHPLSKGAVRTLSSGTGINTDQLFTVTSGNPFFVTEVLGIAPRSGVPATVMDATLARLARVDDGTRRTVEQLSVVPTAIDHQLLDALLPGRSADLIAAEQHGIVEVTPHEVKFRHELTRCAIVDSLAGMRRARLNRRVLSVLLQDPTADLARIMHHAAEAGDWSAIVRFGPEAARLAAAGGSHREAAAHYQLLLGRADSFSAVERAALLEGYAVESRAIGESDRGVLAQQQAVALRRTLGDDAAVGAGLRWLSRVYWWSGHRREAEEAASEAVRIAERVGDPHLLATCLTQQTSLDIMDFRARSAAPDAERATELARSIDDRSTLSHALNNLALARWFMGGDGRDLMAESLQVALDAADDDAVSRAYNNMVSELWSRFQFDAADAYIDAGTEFAQRTDQVVALHLMHAYRAYLQLGRAEWASALATVASMVDPVPIARFAALTITGRIQARRGDPEAVAQLDEAVALAYEMSDLQTLGIAVSAAAEAAWLRGDDEAVRTLAAGLYDELSELDSPCLTPELAYWLMKAGYSTLPRPSEEPYGLLVAGRWRDAARAWQTAGCSYEYAMALTESPDPTDILAGLEKLDALGAKPLARITRLKLQEMGITRVPRGPIATTRDNPAGLTARQLDVLNLIARGLTNAQIADELVMSVHTAANHVAAILTKLGVQSRDEAAAYWSAQAEN
ncbi:ATP-binding protein [Kribbella sp. NPDC004536]|uniref:ATP-binding protein n=1 Tax=Kribbella sp. NPDC004536 TaxID=3364106 RepID=UPI0036872149